MEARPVAESLGKIMGRVQTSKEETSSLKAYKPSPKAMEKAMLAAGVDKAYVGWRLKDFSLEKHLDWRCGGYYLSGVQGCGKSCLAAAIVADRMDPNHPQTVAVQKEQFIDRENRGLVWEWPDKSLRWFNARELCDYLRDSWGQGGEDKERDTYGVGAQGHIDPHRSQEQRGKDDGTHHAADG